MVFIAYTSVVFYDIGKIKLCIIYSFFYFPIKKLLFFFV